MQQKHGERKREMAKKVGDDGIALDFQVGDEAVEIINVKRSFLFDVLPCPLLVFSPTTQGSYPVLLFFHGFMLQPNCYKSLLLHISSHQYIIVAPQVLSSAVGLLMVSFLLFKQKEIKLRYT